MHGAQGPASQPKRLAGAPPLNQSPLPPGRPNVRCGGLTTRRPGPAPGLCPGLTASPWPSPRSPLSLAGLLGGSETRQGVLRGRKRTFSAGKWKVLDKSGRVVWSMSSLSHRATCPTCPTCPGFSGPSRRRPLLSLPDSHPQTRPSPCLQGAGGKSKPAMSSKQRRQASPQRE